MDAATIEAYVKAGNLAGRARDYGATLVQEGARLADVATEVEAFIRKHGGEPAFPCCLSMNQEAAHYTPGVGDTRTFAKGDVVKVDCGVQVDGWIGDTAITVEVASTARRSLVEAPRAALAEVERLVKDGIAVNEIGAVVERTLLSLGLRPIVNLTGHSVDRYHQHAGLSVPSVPVGRDNVRVKAPIAVAIEPFATDGEGRVKDAGGGHIFHFVAAKPQRDPVARQALAHIQAKHPDLPFAERWVAEAIPESKVPYAMRILERSGAVKQYPILREAGNGWVAQHEHTFLVLPDRVLVTTRG